MPCAREIKESKWRREIERRARARRRVCVCCCCFVFFPSMSWAPHAGVASDIFGVSGVETAERGAGRRRHPERLRRPSGRTVWWKHADRGRSSSISVAPAAAAASARATLVEVILVQQPLQARLEEGSHGWARSARAAADVSASAARWRVLRAGSRPDVRPENIKLYLCHRLTQCIHAFGLAERGRAPHGRICA